MKLMEIYRQIVIEAENDYRGQHSAPGKDDAPLHDLTKLFPMIFIREMRLGIMALDLTIILILQ